MIKPLRRKFVIISMFFVLVVMLVAFCCNYAFNKANMYDESIAVMEQTIRDGAPKNLKTFLVVANNYGGIFQIRGYPGSVAEDIGHINAVVETALKSSSSVGEIAEADLRYMRSGSPVGVLIAFTSTAEEKIALKGMIYFSFYIYFCCSLVFLFVSIYLAKITTKPVEKSFNQKKQLIADASHELKTPVTAILASADVLLSSDTVSEEDKSFVVAIKESAADMSTLLANMLTLAKSDDEKPVRMVETVDFSNLATSVILGYEPIFFESGKDFRYDIDDGLKIKGNEGELRQLIRIFLDNAKKYSDEKGTVFLSLKAVKDRAVLTVYNTGTPIPADEIDKIFDRFYRVDKVRSTASGYGLGLSIAKSIAEAHSTKIHVVSNENGTSFAVSFKSEKG